MKKITLLFISFLWFAAVFAQKPVDYQPKSLLKTLQAEGIDLMCLKEISIADSNISHKSFQGKFFQITRENTYNYEYIYIGRVNSCRAGGCSISGHEENPEDKLEFFDYYIVFDSNKTVRLVKVFNYEATHGQEITSKGWLRQFIGYNGDEPLQVEKNIDAISGATISVYAITFDIEMKTEILKNIMKNPVNQ